MDNKQIDNEEEMIQQAFQELLNDYLATKHRKRVEIITKAFNFANEAHKGIRRLSGEPYILHPISVAKIVCNEIGLGSTSICSALLHDVVEDTDYTVEDIENKFEKLKLFYREVMPAKGWETYDTISVKWSHQVVATRRKKAVKEVMTYDPEDDEVIPDLETMGVDENNATLAVEPKKTKKK